MNILFFLVHPAHFHLFKNTIKILKKRGHTALILIKSKDVLEKLLEKEGWCYINTLSREKQRKSNFSTAIVKFKDLLIRENRLIKVIFRKKIDIMVGTEIAIAHVGSLLNIPSFIFNEDDTAATPENYLFYPFAKKVIMPFCVDVGKWKKKKIVYEGYHELAYLSPKYFEPKIEVVKQFNPKTERYFLLRLVSLSASHDIGKKGISNNSAKLIINKLSKKGNVYISAERKLCEDLEKHRIKIKPENIHHAIYYADLMVGDSQTMIAEAAVLGTPSIRFNDFVGKLSIIEELESKYSLTYGIRTSEPGELSRKIDELLNYSNIKQEWQKRRKKMLSEKIDVTAFIVWLIENYPESIKVMKENPDYQRSFM